jgi:hypothetical protein
VELQNLDSAILVMEAAEKSSWRNGVEALNRPMDSSIVIQSAMRPRFIIEGGKLAKYPNQMGVFAQNWRDGARVRAEPCSLGSSTLIAMVQTANFREGNDFAGRGRLYGTRPRAVLAERKMRSDVMMVSRGRVGGLHNQYVRI